MRSTVVQPHVALAFDAQLSSSRAQLLGHEALTDLRDQHAQIERPPRVLFS